MFTPTPLFFPAVQDHFCSFYVVVPNSCTIQPFLRLPYISPSQTAICTSVSTNSSHRYCSFSRHCSYLNAVVFLDCPIFFLPCDTIFAQFTSSSQIPAPANCLRVFRTFRPPPQITTTACTHFDHLFLPLSYTIVPRDVLRLPPSLSLFAMSFCTPFYHELKFLLHPTAPA